MNKPKHIKLYSTMSCPYCKMEKAWLDQNNIPHEVVYVDRDPQEAKKMVAKTKQLGVPVTEIVFEDEKTQFVIGFDKPTLSKLLQ